MAPSTPRPLWGWTTPARLWLSIFGALAALWLIAGTGVPDVPVAPAPRLVVDPNTAPPAVFHALPKLGPAMVGRIVAARAVAPFRSIDDLDARVRGIGPATRAALRPYLQFERSETETRATPPVAAVPAPAPAPATATRPVRLARSP
jgi:competence protein ComEA